jgi:hypothetical protein
MRGFGRGFVEEDGNDFAAPERQAFLKNFLSSLLGQLLEVGHVCPRGKVQDGNNSIYN